MFRFFKKKTDLPDPSAVDQHPDPEAGQPVLETLAADHGVGVADVPAPGGEPQLVDDGNQIPGQTISTLEDAVTAAPRVGLLSRWFKRNPEQPPSGGDSESKPEDSGDDEAPATATPAAEGDDLIGDAWVVDPPEELADESEEVQGALETEETEETEEKSSWLAKLRGGLAKLARVLAASL